MQNVSAVAEIKERCEGWHKMKRLNETDKMKRKMGENWAWESAERSTKYEITGEERLRCFYCVRKRHGYILQGNAMIKVC